MAVALSIRWGPSPPPSLSQKKEARGQIMQLFRGRVSRRGADNRLVLPGILKRLISFDQDPLVRLYFLGCFAVNCCYCWCLHRVMHRRQPAIEKLLPYNFTATSKSYSSMYSLPYLVPGTPHQLHQLFQQRNAKKRYESLLAYSMYHTQPFTPIDTCLLYTSPSPRD